MANLSNINNKFLVTTGGNVLINKTAANNATVGTQIMSTGDVNATVSGDTVARFNRLSSDGEIIRIQKDTSTVGYIGSNTTGGDPLLDIGSDSSGDSVMRFLTSGSERIRIDKDGNVGIGATSPTNILQVHQSDASSNAYVHITHTDGGSAATDGLSIGLESDGVNAAIRNRENGYLRMFTNNTERMRINSSGNVGIGVIPEAVTAGNIRLDIGSVGCGITSRQNQELVITSNADYIKATTSNRNPIMINLQNDGNFNILNAPAVTAGSNLTFTSRFFIKTDGKVGIGTTSPGQKLDVAGTIRSNANEGKLILNSTATNGNEYQFISIDTGNLGIYDGTAYRLWIADSGNVGIGTTSPTAKLKVIGENDAWTCQIENTQALPYGLSVNTIGTAGTTFNSAFYTHTGAGMYIVNNGKVGIGTTSPGSKLTVNPSSAGDGALRLGVLNQEQYVFETGISGITNAALILKDVTTPYTYMTFRGGNVGIGTTSPDEKLDITGGYLKFNGGDYGIKGSAGLTYYATSEHYFYTGGTERIRITSGGYTQIKASGGSSRLYLEGTSGTHFLTGTSGGDFGIYNDTASSYRMFINSSGKVGIGTTSPIVPVHIVGTAVNNPSNGNGGYEVMQVFDDTSYATGVGGGIGLGGKFNSSGTDTIFSEIRGIKENSTDSNYAGALTFSTRANGANITERMRINSAGNVGIGTTSPAKPLHVIGEVRFDNDLSLQATRKLYLDGGNDTYITEVAANDIGFNTAGGERMRITSGGDVLVAKTSQGLLLTGIELSQDLLRVTKTSAAPVQINRKGTDGDILNFYKDTSQQGSVSITSSAVTYNTSSDYRMKKNIKPLENGLERLSKLKPVKFDWKLNNESTEGFIAHEVQEIFPHAVTGEKDGENMQSMDYGRITPLLVKAIQELKAEIELLKSK